MMPNERWDDFALDKQFEQITNVMAATSALPTQVAKLTGAVEANTKRIDSHHKWIEALEARNEKRFEEVKGLCERIGSELRADTRERARNRISIVIAIISAGGIVAAAVISAPQ